MPRLFAVLALALSTVLAPAADPPKDFFFQPANRVVFLGDSITEQYEYSTDVELYLTTRFPTAGMLFLNAGIGGDTAAGGANRFQTQVLDEKPTKVTINFGMNDGGYGVFNPAANKVYVEKTAAMLAAAKRAGVKVALLSPNAVDYRLADRFRLYLETQKEFYAPLKDLAATRDAVFVDQYAATRKALEVMEKNDPTAKTVRPFGDGVHTSPAGGLLMAHAILTGLKAPALVSDVTVDAKSGTAAAKRCMVTGLAATPDGVAFTRADEALPIPVQKDWLPILMYMNDLKDLNWYGLTVSGMAAGTYTVSVDGTEVGRYTAGQLAAGVNLGLLTAGPIWEQGNQVFRAIVDKNRIVHGRFRSILLGGDPYWGTKPGLVRREGELALRRKEIETAQTAMYELAKPVPHKFEVVAVK